MKIFLWNQNQITKKEPDNLVIYHQNMSLNMIRNELSVILQANLFRYHLICITSHEEIGDIKMLLPGYKLVISFCQEKSYKEEYVFW